MAAHPVHEASAAAAVRRRRLWGLLVGAALVVSAPAVVGHRAAAESRPARALSPEAFVYNGAGSSPRFGLIGDSAFAGIPVANAFAPLRAFNYLYDAEVCRRTALASCHATGPAPPNAISTLRQRSGQWGSVLVMATGYNDPGTNFGSAIDQIMAEAARQGIPKVMWLTLRTAPVGFVPSTYRSTSGTFRDNNLIMLQKAQQYAGRLVIADWAGFSAGHNDWFGPDGIHFHPAGAQAAAQFLATSLRRVLGGENITPTRTGAPAPAAAWTYLRYGMGGTAVADLQRLLIAAGVRLPDGVTGVFSINTVYAVQTFQRSNGIHANGIVDEATAQALGAYSGSWTDLRTGSTGSRVARVQRTLVDRGIYLSGGATGSFTIGTFYAVQTFQRRQGLTVTGVVDATTARALGLIVAQDASSVWTALSTGSTGPNVARAQLALLDAGVVVRGGADGVFSVWTMYAVQTFQRSVGMSPTGVIDVETAQRLGLFDLDNPVATLPLVRLGSAGSAVAAAERALAAAGVRVVDGVDGVFKIGDYYAVQTFQRRHGLPVTGVVDVATAEVLDLYALPAPLTTWTNLALGATGPSVAAAERALVAAGVRVVDGVDGVFKIGDYYAVQTFQRMRGLAVTGEVDVPTAGRLGLLAAPAPAVALSVLAAPAPAVVATTTTTTTVAPPSTTTTTTVAPPATTSPSTTSTSTSSTSTSTSSVVAPGAGVLAGTAWIDADSDGIRDVGEPAVAGLTVTLRDDRGNPLQTAVTGEQGEFRFAGLADGDYRVEVGVPTGYTVTAADREVGVPVGVDPDDVDSDVVLDGTGTLAATPLVVLGGVAHDVGIGLVAAPPSEPPTSTSGPAPTSVEPADTTTAEDTAPPSSAPTTTADTTPLSELSTTTVPTATSTSSTPAPTTTPTTAPQSTVSTVHSVPDTT